MRIFQLSLNPLASRAAFAAIGVGLLVAAPALFAQTADVHSGAQPQAARANAELRGEAPQPRAMYQKARAAEKTGSDAQAVAAYKATLQAAPQMIEALHDLAYLQATSKDPAVRNPKEAVLNAEKVVDMAERRFIQRRQTLGPRNLVDLYANLPVPATFYKVNMLNTLAAAYASAGNFDAGPKDLAAMRSSGGACATGAVSVASLAADAAQSIASKSPSPENKQLATAVVSNLNQFRAHKALTGVPQVRTGVWQTVAAK